MKDNVDKLFQERFSGHEVPVDPALWAAIEGQLLVSAATTDPVNELFRERFQGHELPVDPAVWDGIGRQLGHAPPPASTSAWTWAASAAAVVVVGAGLWWSTTEAPSPVAEQRTASSAVVTPPVVPAAEPTPNEAAPSTSAPALVPATAPASIATAPTPVTRPGSTAAQPGTAEPVATTPALVQEGPAVQMPQPAPKAAIPPPVMSGQQQTTSSNAVVDPQRVEAIIQEITERTKSEALAAEGTEGELASEGPEESPQAALELFMPNTFTPNGDGVNDTYALSMEGYQRMSIRVLSLKTDKLVFSTMNAEPWTGAGCEDGMYVVVVEAVAEDGRSLSKAKVVWLNRDRMN